jgi:benzodiazapine receptor
LAGWLLLCFAAAVPGAWWMPGEWYAGLTKPGWNPPGWVFGPVWSLLYTLMAVSAWMVWRQGGFSGQKRPLGWFLIQLVLNAGWTPLFFGAHWMGVALVEMLLLWLAIAMTIRSFRGVNRMAAWLLVPYLVWVSFALLLNAALWYLNRG